MRKVLLLGAALLAAVTVSAGAAEGVIRGDMLSIVTPAPPPAGYGSSAPSVLRDMPRAEPLPAPAPPSNLGADADGPVLDLPCQHTVPPTCR